MSATTFMGSAAGAGSSSTGGEVFVFPASFTQERFWFVQQYAPASPAYHVPIAHRLRGALDAAMLQSCLDALRARHEALRTTFELRGNGLVQLVHPPTPWSLRVLDVSAEPEATRFARAWTEAEAEARCPFDLSAGPPGRSLLIRLAEEDHLLLTVWHHIVADAWSIEVFHRELSALHVAFVAGRDAELPELPVQYGDYSAWLREQVDPESLHAHREWWQQRLNGAPPALDLPADYPRPPVESYRGCCLARELGPALVRRLEAVARAEGATLFMLLVAAWEVLLARLSGEEDFVVGVPVAGREREETQGVFGCFVNTLPLRSDVTGDPAFRELLRRVRASVLGALEHQELTFDQLVGLLEVRRDPGRTPIFQTMFQLHESPDSGLVLPGLRVEPLPIDTHTAKFDLTLMVRRTTDALRTTVEFATDLFEADRIERLLGQWETLLGGIAADPAQPLHALPLLTDTERAQLVTGWNDTDAPYPADRCLHQLFDEQAARTPGATALLFRGQSVTYGELATRARRLARRLRAAGVTRNVPVGIHLGRSPDLVAGLLAILTAGGAYVPLEPSHPAERLALIFADSGATLVLTDAAHVGTVRQSFTGARPILVDEPSGKEADGPAPENMNEPGDRAYVLYTSGSTGRPKGVAVRHRGVVNFLSSMRREPGLGADDTLLAITTVGFDISVLELFLPLTVGARIVLAGDDQRMDGVALAAAMEAHGVTVLQATPATWQMLLLSGWAGRPALKALCGGEALSPDLAAQLVSRVGSLWNMYGPTETTVWSTLVRVAPGEPIVIGRPIANTRVRVVDRHGQPVPIGVPGELWIGGDGVAEGYLNRPELTAERFLPDPFGRSPGDRVYRTGDQVRWRRDGTLEFVGRLDDQLKIRGFRIEPGEIEAVLGRHPHVALSAVAARGGPGDARLIAWCSPRDGRPDPGELRAFLRERLPEYMVPSDIVVLDDLPLTPSGKVNRRVLPTPAATIEVAVADRAAPRTNLEAEILAIWEQVLGRSGFGTHSNFFELGGHSLLAVRVAGELARRRNAAPDVGLVFRAPTVADMAQLLESGRYEDASPVITTLQPRGTRPPLLLINGDVGQWNLARRLGDDQPCHALRVNYEIEALAARRRGEPVRHYSLDELADRYLALLRTRWPHGPYHLAGFCLGGLIAFRLAQRLRAAGESVPTVLVLDAFPPVHRSALGRRIVWLRRQLERLRSGSPRDWLARLRRWRRERVRVGQLQRLATSERPDADAENAHALLVHFNHVFANAALQSFRPEPYDGEALLVYLVEPHARPSMLRRHQRRAREWARLIRGGVETFQFEGDHGNFFEPPLVDSVATAIRGHLDRIHGGPRS